MLLEIKKLYKWRIKTLSIEDFLENYNNEIKKEGAIEEIAMLNGIVGN